MSKNLTRKGLALGAIVALASTVIAGSPAFAAQTITAAPALGTSLNTTLATPFVVAANVSGATTDTAAATLKFSVSNAGKNLLTFAAVGASASAANTAALAGTRVADTTNTTVVSAASAGLTSAKTAAIAISTSATVSTTADVTAWLDLDGDNVIDANEDTANTVSVKFLANADLAAATSITAPLIGAVALTGKSVITPALNSNYATNVTIDYTAATSVTSTGATTMGTDGAWTATAVIAAATAGAYTAQAKVATVALGTAASTTVAAITTSTAVAALTAGNDATAAGVVRAGAKAATAVLTLKKAAVGAAAALPVAAGIPVVVTVKTKAVAAPATSLITVDGTAINATDEGTITLNKVTDANGLVSLAIVSATGTVTDAIEITALAEGVSAAALNVVWTAVAYTAASTSAFASTERSIVEGGSTTLTYSVKDQFGVAIAVPSRLKFVVGYATVGPVAADATTYVALVGGSASITVTDTTANVDAAIAVTAALEVQDAATLNYAAPASGAVTAAAHNVNVTATAAAFATAPATTFGPVAVDTALTLTIPAINNAGGLVTIAATGVTFTVNSVDYANTVTVITAAGGVVPVVTAKSTTAGAKNITFTVGTNVTTSVLTVSAAVETSGTVLTLDAPANILPGRTLVVTGTVADKFGNPVNTSTGTTSTLVVSYTGPGLIVGSLPTETDASGAFSFRVLLGANETGSASVSASYDADGSATVSAAVTVAKTVTIGAVATNAAVITSKNGRVYVTVNSAAGFKSYVKVGFSVKPSFTTTGSKLVSYYVGAGKRVAVRVYVRGGLVASQAITVK